MRARGIQDWTIAEMAKPSTSAHQTSQAIRNAFQSPSPSLSKNMARHTLPGYVLARRLSYRRVTPELASTLPDLLRPWTWTSLGLPEILTLVSKPSERTVRLLFSLWRSSPVRMRHLDTPVAPFQLANTAVPRLPASATTLGLRNGLALPGSR